MPRECEKARPSRAGLTSCSVYRNRQSKLVILVVPVEAWLRDFVTALELIALFSRQWSLLQLELAQFQIAFQFCRDHLALPAPAFLSYPAFVLLTVKHRLLGRRGWGVAVSRALTAAAPAA